MTKMQRIKNILIGLAMLLFGLIMLILPEEGFAVVSTLLSLTITLSGVRTLFYYATMARHMVGGKSMLFRGMILLDFGIFTLTLSDMPRAYIVLYLLGSHAFSGGIDLMRAMESRRLAAPTWRRNLVSGGINLLIALAAVACMFTMQSMEILVYLYTAGLVYAALSRIASVFQKTAIVYIQ